MNLENTLRENLIKADSRKFGSVFEYVIEQLNQLTKADNVSHDRYCPKNDQRIEMKSIRAFSREDVPCTIAEWALSETSNKSLVLDRDKYTATWNGGFCQIKPECFDVLYYTAVFHDRIYMFRNDSHTLLSDSQVGYCTKQHRNGSMGQFHISAKNISYHIQNYLFFTLTYEQLVFILKAKNVKLNVA